MKKSKISLIIFLFLIILPISAFASGDDIEKINEKIESQNQSIKESSIPGSERNNEGFEKLLNSLEEKKGQTQSNLDTDEVKSNLKKSIFEISVTARKYSVPLYMIIIIFYIIMTTLLGSKSYIKRKGFIFAIAIITILFLIILNIPVAIIYFQHTPISQVFNADTIYLGIFRTIFFLKENSIAIATLFIVYGIMNIMLSRDDIPRRMFGGYLIKASLIMFLAFQLLPGVIVYII